MLASRGHLEEAREILCRLLERRREDYVPPIGIAWLYMGLGEMDEMFEWLNRAVDEHDPHEMHLAVKPIYDGIRGDPRFAELLRKARLA
jgi:hypothetical protein